MPTVLPHDLTILTLVLRVEYLQAAILGARLSYGSGDRSDTTIDAASNTLTLGPEDAALTNRLIAGGGRSGEDKFLRTINLSIFMRAPLRFWVDLDTYKIAPPEGGTTEVAGVTVKQSSSLMHVTRRNRPHFTRADFSHTTDQRLSDLANEKLGVWLAAGAKRTADDPTWLELQDAIGRGYLYTAQWSTNYAVLRNMYHQRRAHRQGEFRALCAWLEGNLPCAQWITQKEVT